MEGEEDKGIGALVERRLARSWSRWPLIMADDRGGWRRTMAEVRSGQVVKRPASMAWHQVERAGEKAQAW